MPRPTNALIVDDEAHARAFVRLLLKELGITATWEAADGQRAVEMVQQHRPQFVLMDINLPQLGGLEALAKMRELGIDVPVMMVTSQSAMTAVSEAMRLGAVGYLLKHAPKDEALATLRDVLESLEDDDEGATG